MGIFTDQSTDDFKEFCSKLVLENGDKMVLEPFQVSIMEAVLAGTPEVTVCIPTGNGKTTLMAAFGLYKLIAGTNETVILAAAARDQADILRTQAAGFVDRSKWLQKYVRVYGGYRKIISRDDSGVMQVVAANQNTGEGVIPSVVLLDEYHVHQTADLHGMLRDKTAKRNGQIVTISTAGSSEDTPFGRLRARCLGFEGFRQSDDGVFKEHWNEDYSYIYLEWSLSDDDDHEDFELVKAANPLSIHSVESLERRYHSPSMEPWQWARYTCGIWLGGENSAFDAVAWRACGRGTGLRKGEPCWVGMDVGWKDDATAIVPFVYDEEEDLQIVGVPTIIQSPKDGSSTSYKTILDELRNVHAKNPIETLVFDPNAEGQILAEMISDELKIKIVPFKQDPTPLAEAAMGLGEAIRAHKILHPNDRELTNNVLAAGAKVVSQGSWRIVKQKGGRKIDAALALCLVRHKRFQKPKRTPLEPDEFVVLAA
jgi:phage terminase large subunit-like protein